MAHPYSNRNVLVLGGAGLVGQSLIRQLLDQGAHVRATQFRRRKIDLTHDRLEVLAGDLTDPSFAKSVHADMDISFIAAARVGGARANAENKDDLIMYNLGLSSSLIHLASKMRLDKCSFISSSFVYKESDKPHREEDGFLWHPTSYGLGWIKRYMETLCRHFHNTSSTQYTIIRPTAYYGPHDSFDLESCHVIPALIMKSVNGDDPLEIWGDGTELRCFTYVDDLVEGLLLATEKHAICDPLNICTREVTSINKLVDTILKVIGHNPTIVHNTSKPTSLKTVICDPSKAEHFLGWRAKTTLKDGIAKTVRGALSLV